MSVIATNNYASLRDFMVRTRTILPAPKETWRLVKDQPIGSIIGLPSIQGIAVATNGILVAIERSNGEILFGHFDWFRTDKDEKIQVAEQPKNSAEDLDSMFKTKKSSMFNLLMGFGK